VGARQHYARVTNLKPSNPTRLLPQPPKPVSLRDAVFAAPCGGAGMWLLLARVWLCEDL